MPGSSVHDHADYGVHLLVIEAECLEILAGRLPYGVSHRGRRAVPEEHKCELMHKNMHRLIVDDAVRLDSDIVFDGVHLPIVQSRLWVELVGGFHRVNPYGDRKNAFLVFVSCRRLQSCVDYAMVRDVVTSSAISAVR